MSLDCLGWYLAAGTDQGMQATSSTQSTHTLVHSNDCHTSSSLQSSCKQISDSTLARAFSINSKI